ncbi:hypothetical protein JTE90_004347 [Oedothorax gibbosus]|uniref:polyribonucleotide nucleotidyltransferase n=1 Tax=Oedothorax gibbosus TaxID=931172 RepID=A0AAV6VNE5_9ARAC|nr:hypothetical protein JTE90_004347 [Oedothorax gibbosus]
MALFFKRRPDISRKYFYRKCHTNDFWKNNKSIDVEVPLSRQPLKFSFGKLARFTDGCCVARLGDTEVMVTAVSKQKAVVASFVPLLVDYRQKSAAAGRIPTNHLRRELGPTEKEILTSRIIDRSVRPLFPKGFGNETQLSCNLFAVDGINDPDVLTINAASAALSISNIPWNGPIGAVRVGYVDGEVVINPSRKEITKSSLNLVVAATEHNQVVMLDASADNMVQQDFMKALKAGVKETQVIIRSINEIQKKFGSSKVELDHSLEPSEEIIDSAKLLLEAKVTDILSDFSLHKVSRGQTLDVLKQEAFEKLKENYSSIDPPILYEAINVVVKETFRTLILETGKRCDGRGLEDVRDISCSVNNNKILHGSSLFQRGQTQVRCTVAFDSLDSAFRSDAVSVLTGGLKEKNFMLHYEFPPYATNEIGRVGAYGRREMGHGALAERSLRPVMPSEFPFTTQLTAEVLESNGSSSMASVCGGSLALMDAGVPISTPVAGVAMGLISVPDEDKPYKISDYRILTDILGLEDYMGDMDFKIAGSKKGITAAQLDIKIAGLPLPIIMEAIKQGADAKSKILSIMNATISKPRETKKDCWPVSEKLEVPMHKLSHFYGFSGVNIKKLRAETGVQITSMENGVFSVFAPNSEAMAEAKEVIDKLLTEEKAPDLEFGGIYTAKIVELRDSGVMVTLYPSMKATLLHNTQLDQRKIHHPSALGLEVGQEIKVKYLGRDPATGSMRLSRKVLLSIPSQLVKNFISPSHSKVDVTKPNDIKS